MILNRWLRWRRLRVLFVQWCELANDRFTAPDGVTACDCQPCLTSAQVGDYDARE
jgi:hypothetical protein